MTAISLERSSTAIASATAEGEVSFAECADVNRNLVNEDLNPSSPTNSIFFD